jgi:predicted DNA-binding transcriptional regulator AlpA
MSVEDEFWQARDCEKYTGIPAGTWRFWASSNQGPPSFRMGRRRVWRRSAIVAWVEGQEQATALLITAQSWAKSFSASDDARAMCVTGLQMHLEVVESCREHPPSSP